MNYHYMVNSILFPSDHMDKYEIFMQQYGDKSEDYILEEITRVKGLVPQEIIHKYIRNLERFSQMEGFITNEQQRKINRVKDLLTEGTSRNRRQSVPTSQSFGTSLLLWFLILAAIWPKRYPVRRPYPPRPYPPYRPYPFF